MSDYPEILRDLHRVIGGALEKSGLDRQQAEALAGRAVGRIHKHFAGQQIYIPRATVLRDREMISRFDGTNKARLCREYGISEQRFYQILSRIRQETRARSKGLLDLEKKD